MNPKDYKDKFVTHVPSRAVFKVNGGKKMSGIWYLKDEQEKLYLLEECQLVIDADISRLKAFETYQQLVDFHNQVGRERFEQACKELEKTPVESAAVDFLFCNSWEDFENLVEGYEISKATNPVLNTRFRALLKEKGLASRVGEWYRQAQAGEVA